MDQHIARIAEGGRVLIPSEIRRLLGLEIGEDVVLEVSENQLHISSLKAVVKNAQAKIESYTKGKISLTKNLKQMREEERE